MSLDDSMVMGMAVNSTTACADCENRGRDNKKPGFCEVYRKTSKPSCVFRGVPCTFYKSERERRQWR